jgi:hypothetical protein
MSTALVHIGTHKTGTTAFQQWAQAHQAQLLGMRNVKYYEGLFGPSHFELALLCMRGNRTMSMQTRIPDSRLDEWRREVSAHVAEQVAHDAPALLISAEALSYLRYEDEVRALQELLLPREMRMAVCLRDEADFLASYREAIRRWGESPSRYRSSHKYVEPDTWLVQWDDMLGVWRGVLGEESVVTFSYEESMSRRGSTIPSVLEALGIDSRRLPPWDGFTANVTREAHQAPSRGSALLSALRRRLRKTKRLARVRATPSTDPGPT